MGLWDPHYRCKAGNVYDYAESRETKPGTFQDPSEYHIPFLIRLVQNNNNKRTLKAHSYEAFGGTLVCNLKCTLKS